MKIQRLIASVMLLAGCASSAWAQSGPPRVEAVATPAEPNAIPLYGAATPGSKDSEVWIRFMGQDLAVRNVSRPTLTPVLPKPGTANGAAVIVAPGGAFMMLAMDLEGNKVARALADRGITAFVLKYRLIPTPRDEAEAGAFMQRRMSEALRDPANVPALGNPQSTEDGLAALKLVRSNAAKWGLDPARVGIIGFSAGAMTALTTALAPAPADRPAFVGYIYGPQAPVSVPAGAPPLFDAIALDDPLFGSVGFPIVKSWRDARRSVEVHGYQQGGHGFGLGVPNTTTTLMIDEFIAWLSMQGFLARKDAQ